MTGEVMGALAGVFLAGLSMGATACALHCSPVFFYVGGTADGWKAGLRYVLAFSLSRLLGITLLGALAGGVGSLLVTYLVDAGMMTLLRYAAAALVVVLGLSVLLGFRLSAQASSMCRVLRRPGARGRLLSMAVLGLLIGITPLCPVSLGVLNYIAFGLESVALGAVFGFTFGLGSAVLTPALAIGPLVGMTSRLFSTPARLGLFRRASGAILVLLGLALFLAV